LTRTPPGRELGRRRAHHLHDGRLGRGIHRLPGFDDLRADRREEDDAPRPLRGEDAPRRLQHVEVPLHVHAHHAVEFFLGVLEDRLAHVDARRADHRIEAPEALLDGVQRRLRRRAIDDVERVAIRLTMRLADRVGDPLCLVPLDVEAGDARPLLGTGAGDRFADARSGADDRHDAPRQPEFVVHPFTHGLC
jgi:hypothetical protein